ncbi:MAG: hypothetical protein Q9190_007390 [Brigantiaea leucoxantha]
MSSWKCNRLSRDENLVKRDALTRDLLSDPYNPHLYLDRALQYESLAYPDLAAGDAYRALLLTDEIADESGEYHSQATHALEKHRETCLEAKSNGDVENERTGDASTGGDFPTSADYSDNGEASDIQHYNESLQRTLFVILTRTLLACGDLRSAFDFSSRGLRVSPNDPELSRYQKEISENYCKKQRGSNIDCSHAGLDHITELPERCFVRRELYPWNRYEPDRFSDQTLAALNARMRSVAPKCEVRVASLPVLQGVGGSHLSNSPTHVQQLGVFAIEDIRPHELVLKESSILTANNRLHDSLCDACSSPLPPLSSSESPLPSCQECEDVIFCSVACHEAAMSLYHPAVCGKSDLEAVAKDPSPTAASDALYLLLLGRAFALAETQNAHPLDLAEIKYLCADFSLAEQHPPNESFDNDKSASKKLPFTFNNNILAPLHLFEKMELDIFASLYTTDTWVIQTLFAKFRGVASARMHPHTGFPEVCAVHPMWCLANHSCVPNVKWEWGGDITFEARGKDDVVIWGGMNQGEEQGGIRKNQEVLNHYCDIDLDVDERREWAIGPLGGVCVCKRCVWEEAEKSKEI